MASATSTLSTLATSIIGTSVEFFTTLVTTYWPYILAIGAVIAILKIFGGFVGKGLGTHK